VGIAVCVNEARRFSAETLSFGKVEPSPGQSRWREYISPFRPPLKLLNVRTHWRDSGGSHLQVCRKAWRAGVTGYRYTCDPGFSIHRLCLPGVRFLPRGRQFMRFVALSATNQCGASRCRSCMESMGEAPDRETLDPPRRLYESKTGAYRQRVIQSICNSISMVEFLDGRLS